MQNVKNQAVLQERMKEINQLRAEAEDQKAQAFEDSIKSELFPSDKISEMWVQSVRRSIRKTAPVMLRMGLQDFAEVMKSQVVTNNDKTSVSLFQFGVLTNSLECVSPDDIGLSNSNYSDFISETIVLIEYYKKRIKEIRIDGDTKVDADLQIKLAALTDKNSKKPLMGQA